MKTIWNILIILMLLANTHKASGQLTAVEKFNTYIISNSCFYKKDTTEGCFESQKFHVLRKDGRSVNIDHVYRYKLNVEPASKPLYLHFFMGYLKLLRNAIESEETQCLNIDRNGDIKSDYDCLSLLQDQLKYMDSKSQTLGNLIVWKQGVDYPSAMVQSGMAYLYSTIAILLKNKGHEAAANDLFEKAKRIGASLDIQQTMYNGGVRSRTFTGSDITGWLYHSSQRTGQDFALNQQAHIIRDAIYFYYQYDLFLKSIEEEMSDATRRQLINRFLKPLQILTAKNDPLIPNLTNYMKREVPTQDFGYYWSFYRIDADSLKGKLITAKNECEYHYHTLDLFYGIIADFKTKPEKASKRGLFNFLNTGENIYHKEMRLQMDDVLEDLLDTKRGPRGQRIIETIGKQDSNNALFQFFLSATTLENKMPIHNCTHKESFSEDTIMKFRELFKLDQD